MFGTFVLVPKFVEMPRGLPASRSAPCTTASTRARRRQGSTCFRARSPCSSPGRSPGASGDASASSGRSRSACCSSRLGRHRWPTGTTGRGRSRGHGGARRRRRLRVRRDGEADRRGRATEETGVATGMNTVMRTIGGVIGGQVGAALLAAYTIAGTTTPIGGRVRDRVRGLRPASRSSAPRRVLRAGAAPGRDRTEGLMLPTVKRRAWTSAACSGVSRRHRVPRRRPDADRGLLRAPQREPAEHGLRRDRRAPGRRDRRRRPPAPPDDPAAVAARPGIYYRGR